MIYDNYYPLIYKFKEKASFEDVQILKEQLNLENADKIIDLGCGYGRISNLLLNEGYDVVGVDSSNILIEYAKKNSTKGFKYILSDFTDLSKTLQYTGFNKAYSMFSSIGSTSKDADVKFFKNVSSVLVDGGEFLLEYENFVNYLQYGKFVYNGFYDIESKYRRLMKVNVNLKKMIVEYNNELWNLDTMILLKKWDFQLQLYTYLDLIEMAKNAGLFLDKIFFRKSNNLYSQFNESTVFLKFIKQ